ncbi:MAG: methionine--tRNA ligase [Candidatus Omnitrophica bacterium]|nr:methionine--tRNA ligase [Candidatus Omnitrophota bacterium]
MYLTTPLYYVNASPHIGHSYTSIAADCLARYYRLKGERAFLLTGTDEHGQKIEQAAIAAGKTPQVFVDDVAERFKALWRLLGVSYDDFIRTTEERHQRVVRACLARLHDERTLLHTTYEGWYCTPCETFWTQHDVEAAVVPSGSAACPSCTRPVEQVKEDGWYLPLRESQPWLQNFLRSHKTFIQPSSRFNEIASLLEQPLPEYLCLTRPRQRVGWGIPVPFSEQHVTYVWFDALLNYISAVGYGEDRERFAAHWPADVQFIGKDILRHHAVYWPIILHALGFSDEQMPRLIVAHGWWKIGEQKMSKSLGNIIDPFVVIGTVLKDQPYAADVYRYFLLREIPFGQDGSFSEEAIFTRLSADLANDLGNLVNRTLSMVDRYCHGRLPAPAAIGCAVDDEPLRRSAVGLVPTIEEAMGRVEFSEALEAIMRLVTQANRYIEVAAPWKLAKEADGAHRLHAVLNMLAEVTRVISITLEPFMPSVAQAIWQQLGCGRAPRRLQDATRWPSLASGQAIGPHPVLFPRSDSVSTP